MANPVVKIVGKIAKEVMKKNAKPAAKKAASKAKPAVAKLSPYSGGIKAKVSDNVTVRIKAKPNYEFSKDLSTVNKIAQQNAKSSGSAKANARGLKAANKKTNKVGSKADKALRSRTKSVVMSKEQAVKSYDAMYGKGTGKDITQINKQVTPKNEARSTRKAPKKPTKNQIDKHYRSLYKQWND
jgi:hypothetical protein